ncbi:MAG TPA: hypothetical protein VH054_16635 [Polyangiaceae bacterium]|jgi:hypothetical protein|nr:hypothetical protein [Polyangiaceae bacterium]
MELVPKIPSERLIRGVQLSSALVAIGLVVAAPNGLWKIVAAAVALVIWRPMIRGRALAIEGALDRLESVLVASSRSVSLAALFAFVAGGAIVRGLAVVAFAFAIALAVFALVRDRARSRFLARVYTGEVPELRVERDTEVRGFELLPPVLSGTITDAVIAHVSTRKDYRTSHGPRPLARVTRSFTKMAARLAKRQRAAVFGPSVALSCGALAVVVPWSTSAPARVETKSAITAPACRDAIPYFEERLQAIPGVGRATVVVREHDGLVVYVPKAGTTATPALDANVLGIARSIACDDKLELTLAQPRYVAFDVSAELTVDEDADAAAVQRDAEEQVRALFQPDAHALDNEHFGFGASERSFGYRVRHALRHVSGVKAVKLVIDGSGRDVPLDPTDFPALKSLSIGIVR